MNYPIMQGVLRIAGAIDVGCTLLTVSRSLIEWVIT
jgi:hypothetical protein